MKWFKRRKPKSELMQEIDKILNKQSGRRKRESSQAKGKPAV